MSELQKNTVFVCGGGHQGLSMAAHLALNGNKVTLWNRSAQNIQSIIDDKKIYCDGIISGTAIIDKASADIGEVISDLVMVVTPSSAHKDIAKKLAPFVHKDMVIILNPGRTFGAIEFANVLLENGVVELPHIAETQTIVYTCRRNSSNGATIFALKENVGIASLKADDLEYIMKKIPSCLRSYYEPVDSIVITSLSNVGMVLHCAPVLMNIGWIETEKVDFKYYYDGISPTVANVLEKIDAERVSVAKKLGFEIETLKEWLVRTYGSQGDDIYSCIKSTEAYKEIDAPTSVNTRYIFEDIPNGLVPVESLGQALGVDTPTIKSVLDFSKIVFDTDFRKTGRNFLKEELSRYIDF